MLKTAFEVLVLRIGRGSLKSKHISGELTNFAEKTPLLRRDFRNDSSSYAKMFIVHVVFRMVESTSRNTEEGLYNGTPDTCKVDAEIATAFATTAKIMIVRLIISSGSSGGDNNATNHSTGNTPYQQKCRCSSDSVRACVRMYSHLFRCQLSYCLVHRLLLTLECSQVHRFQRLSLQGVY